MDPDAVEQDVSDGLVAAGPDERRPEVAAAQMHTDRHVRGDVGDCLVDHVGIDHGQPPRVIATAPQECALLRIAQQREIDLVELEIAAAGIREGAHCLAVRLTEIVEEVV